MTELPQQDADALAEAVAAEHAAVFAYGVVQAYVRHPATTRLTSDIVAEHRAHRDAATARLTGSGRQAPQAAPSYLLPIEVADGPSAARLAAQIELETARAWRSLVERATLPEVREEGVRALGDCAVRAAQWNENLDLSPRVAPFPGS
ncbi:MAG: ferritin-like domain-containing protein [Segniliparus sp.]|uniref:ferritin-like domain-containing protein n=1 Tax=Segniliparus sp. TaxID=2804064 RepID=UPI003F2AFACA